VTTILASFPSPVQGVWYLGPVPIRAYALCIIAGIIAALVIGDRRWVARGGERGVIYDIALWAVPFGLIGGRLYHLMTDWRTYFGEGGVGPAAALRIWEGGLGIWGAVAFGGVGAWIACRRRGIPLPAFGDAVAPGIVLAQAIGRLGNYFNQELYGRETTVPWGMEIFYRRDPSGMVDVHSLDGISTGQVAAVVHPTFLYELLWNLAVFVLLIWVDRRYRIGHGRLFALYVAAYCVGRFWVELLRDDTATEIAGIRINVFTATFVFIGAVVYMLLAPKGREDPATLQGSREGLDAESPEEESMVEELAEELVAAARGSGLIAAVTVAGEHETEDAEAVGDDEFKSDSHEDTEPAEIDVEIDDEADVEIAVDDGVDAVEVIELEHWAPGRPAAASASDDHPF
jgi:prolipoprotein diacylglyceryl transferase